MTGQPPYYAMPAMSALFRIVEDDHPPLPEHVSPVRHRIIAGAFLGSHSVNCPYTMRLGIKSISHAMFQKKRQGACDSQRPAWPSIHHGQCVSLTDRTDRCPHRR